MTDPYRFPLADAISKIPAPDGKRFVNVFEHGTLQIEAYAPRGTDPQSPHEKDEVYVVMRGQGTFINGSHRHSFVEGDILFVPAGFVHRFEDFSDDLAVWVIFYGPSGGEKA